METVVSIKIHFACLLKDLCIDEYTRSYLLSRLDAEGTRFLTATLPGLWKSVLTSIERGRYDYRTNTSFSRKGNLPRVFRGFFRRIFDSEGFLLDDPDPQAIAAIRQACEYYYKCSFAFQDSDLAAAEKKFLACEEELAQPDAFDSDFVDACRKSFETYYAPVSNATVDSILQSARPRFGPGSFVTPHVLQDVADLDSGEFKITRASLTGTCRVDQRPFSGFFKAYPSSPETIKLVNEGLTSTVMFVPKDGRGPRTISKEPLFLLKMQLGFFDWISSKLQAVTGKRINFTDQTINRQLALDGSRTRKWATFDLKEASDRVSYAVASRIFRHSPGIYYFISRMRSTHTRLPSGKVLRLNKLSGMGSGLTFPLMALTIHLAVCTHVSKRLGLSYPEVSKNVYVYGDDLVVPKAYVPFVHDALTMVGLKLNLDKSFFKGPFRESCGGDYINGAEVVPVRFKCSWLKMPSVRESTLAGNRIRFAGPHAAVSIERHCRELIKKGLHQTAEYLYTHLERMLGAKLPYVYGNTPYLGRLTDRESQVLLQTSQPRVFAPVAVQRQAQWPDPYRYLATKLRPKAPPASWDFNPLYLERSQTGSLGDWSERYNCSLVVRRNVPAFLLTEGPNSKSRREMFGIS